MSEGEKNLKTLSKRILGSKRFLGDVYSERLEIFTGRNLLKEIGINPSEIKERKIIQTKEYFIIVEKSTIERFPFLRVDQALKLIILDEENDFDGNRKDFLDFQKESNTINIGLYMRYLIRHDLINLNGDVISSSAAKFIDSQATHILTGILWGTLITAIFQINTKGLTNDIIQLKFLEYSRALKNCIDANFQNENDKIFDKSNILKIKVNGTIIPSIDGYVIDFDEFRRFMMNIDRTLTYIENGKGSQINYTLTENPYTVNSNLKTNSCESNLLNHQTKLNSFNERKKMLNLLAENQIEEFTKKMDEMFNTTGLLKRSTDADMILFQQYEQGSLYNSTKNATLENLAKINSITNLSYEQINNEIKKETQEKLKKSNTLDKIDENFQENSQIQQNDDELCFGPPEDDGVVDEIVNAQPPDENEEEEEQEEGEKADELCFGPPEDDGFVDEIVNAQPPDENEEEEEEAENADELCFGPPEDDGFVDEIVNAQPPDENEDEEEGENKEEFKKETNQKITFSNLKMSSQLFQENKIANIKDLANHIYRANTINTNILNSTYINGNNETNLKQSDLQDAAFANENLRRSNNNFSSSMQTKLENDMNSPNDKNYFSYNSASTDKISNMYESLQSNQESFYSFTENKMLQWMRKIEEKSRALDFLLENQIKIDEVKPKLEEKKSNKAKQKKTVSNLAYCLTGCSNNQIMIKLQNNLVAFTSENKTIKICNPANKYECLDTIPTNNFAIYSLIQMRNGLIVSGYYNGQILLFNPLNFQCILALNGHNSCVNNLIELKDGNLASGSYDNCVKIWDKTINYENIFTIMEYDFPIKTICQLKNGFFLVGSDESIKFYDPDKNYECINCEVGNLSLKSCLVEFANGTIAWSFGEKSIKITDPTNNFQFVNQLLGHEGKINVLLVTKSGSLVSGADDKLIKIWNSAKNWECMFTFSGHFNPITSMIELSNGNIASTSNDNTIKIWEYTNEYRCIKTFTTRIDALFPGLIELNDGLLASYWGDKTIKLWVFRE